MAESSLGVLLTKKPAQMPLCSYRRFAYPDTNILSHLANNEHLWGPLCDFLTRNDLCIALAEGNCAELAEATRLHEPLVDMLLNVPSAIVKTGEVIVAEEVAAHPEYRTATLLACPLNQLFLEEGGRETLLRFLGSQALASARDEQRRHAQQIAARVSATKSNYPPSKSGRYTTSQPDEFAAYIAMQWLAQAHRQFLASYQGRVQHLRLEVFRSLRLFALVNFYTYYIAGWRPRLPDFGDRFHLFCLPYCSLAIMERGLSEILRQIKPNHDVLAQTVVRDISFLVQHQSTCSGLAPADDAPSWQPGRESHLTPAQDARFRYCADKPSR